MTDVTGDFAPRRAPPDIVLASFVDGGLPPEARAGVIAHLAACDDCREIVATVARKQQLRLRAVVVPWYRRVAVWSGAAVTLAASALLMLQPQLLRGRPSTQAWADLAAAAGPERTVEARLSGLTTYAPVKSPTRSATAAPAGDNLRLLAVAERLREDAQRDPSAANRHAWGVAALLTGRTGEAVAALAPAHGEGDDDARLQSDLAAAFLALASSTQSTDDWRRALGAAEAAIARDPTLASAWFNRALALEGLGRRGDAHQAWRDYAERFTQDAGWRDEALRRAGGPVP